MSENEKLIEWARSGDHLATRPGLVLELADALEAAEKAHTPTDDERETLQSALLSTGLLRYPGDRYMLADAALAALRRSEPQGEPSDAQVQAGLDAAAAHYATTWVGEITRLPVDFDAMRAALRAAGGAR